MQYQNRHRHSGFGQLWKSDRSESIRVFYVLRTSEVYVGGSRNPVRMPDSLEVEELDFRGKPEPKWLRQESILETDKGASFRLEQGAGFWHISPLDAPAGA
jgi:hypothetical protein